MLRRMEIFGSDARPTLAWPWHPALGMGFVLTAMLAVAVAAHAEEQRSPAQSDLWAKNVVLCYTRDVGHGDDRWSAKNWEGDNFKWLVAQCDAGGTPRKFLFDGFLVMGYQIEDRNMYGLKDKKAAVAQDWSSMLDLYLRTAQNLSRCQTDVARQLGQPQRKAKVILAMPYPDARDTAFGPIAGKTLDLSVHENRVATVKWFIDETIGRWEKLATAGKLDGARLVGFYWMRESISKDYPFKNTDDAALVRALCEHIHAKGLLTHWIPAVAVGRHPEAWSGLGLDCLTQQINYQNHDQRGRPLAMLDDATLVARRTGMHGVQLALSNRDVGLNPRLYTWRQAALANLEAALRLDWKKFDCMNYYNANEICDVARDPKSREYYDALCQWVDGSLTYKDVEALCDRLVAEMKAAGQIDDERIKKMKDMRALLVEVPVLENLHLMEKPFGEW